MPGVLSSSLTLTRSDTPEFIITFYDHPSDHDRFAAIVTLGSYHSGANAERYEGLRAVLEGDFQEACGTFLDKKTAEDYVEGGTEPWDRLYTLTSRFAGDLLQAMGHDGEAMLTIDVQGVTFNGQTLDGDRAFRSDRDHQHRCPEGPTFDRMATSRYSRRHPPAYHVSVRDSISNQDFFRLSVDLVPQRGQDPNEEIWDKYTEYYLNTYLRFRTALWSKAEIANRSAVNGVRPREELEHELQNAVHELLEDHLPGYHNLRTTYDTTAVSFRSARRSYTARTRPDEGERGTAESGYFLEAPDVLRLEYH